MADFMADIMANIMANIIALKLCRTPLECINQMVRLHSTSPLASFALATVRQRQLASCAWRADLANLSSTTAGLRLVHLQASRRQLQGCAWRTGAAAPPPLADATRHAAGLIVNALALGTDEATDVRLLRNGLEAHLCSGSSCSLLTVCGSKSPPGKPGSTA